MIFVRQIAKILHSGAIWVLILVLWCGRVRGAESAAPVVPDLAPGTTITVDNWRNYRQYMSAGLEALFEGRDFWRMPPALRLELRATESVPLPRKYLEDTAKYAARVALTRTANGGFVPRGYVAGLPFPRPLAGDPALTGQRVFWDTYYRYQPRVQAAVNFSYSLDRFGNMTRSAELRAVISQLAFLSDVNQPRTVSEAGQYYSVKYYQQIAPEQGKYSTVLDLVPADPARLDELYEYIPTLRRSLRLSQAARCAPLFGSDYLIDDENDGPPGLPQLFRIDYLGPRRILVLAHAEPAAFDSPGGPSQLDSAYYYPAGPGLIPFAKPSLGQWELRDTYMIALRRLPGATSGYCYSRRVMYVDQENYFGAGELDLYNQAGALDKTQFLFSRPVALPDTHDDMAELVAGPSVGLLVNFTQRHVTASVGLRPCVNSACAESGYLDLRRYASPAALAKIVQ